MAGGGERGGGESGSGKIDAGGFHNSPTPEWAGDVVFIERRFVPGRHKFRVVIEYLGEFTCEELAAAHPKKQTPAA